MWVVVHVGLRVCALVCLLSVFVCACTAALDSVCEGERETVCVHGRISGNPLCGHTHTHTHSHTHTNSPSAADTPLGIATISPPKKSMLSSFSSGNLIWGGYD